jgi:hypothetical protein
VRIWVIEKAFADLFYLKTVRLLGAEALSFSLLAAAG